MATRNGYIWNFVPVWVALCVAVSLFVACGEDSSGTSANTEDVLSSAGEAAIQQSSSSQGFFYSSLGEIPVNADTGTVQNQNVDSLDNVTDSIPDTAGVGGVDTVPVVLEKTLYSVRRVSVDSRMPPLFGLDGAGLVVEALDVANDFAVVAKETSTYGNAADISFESPYVKVSVEGVALEFPGASVPVTGLSLSAFDDLSQEDSVDVSFLSSAKFPRIRTLVIAGEAPAVAMEQAEMEVLRAFHMDEFTELSEQDELARFVALHLLASSLVAEGEGFTFDDIADDIAEDGLWDDPVARAKIADWALKTDATDGFAAIRNGLFAAAPADAPEFEKYLRVFYQKELGISACTSENSGTILHIANTESAYFVLDDSDFSKVTERFVCKAADEIEFASDRLKDVYGFGPGTDGEVRPGAFSGNVFYTYNASLGSWRNSTELEKDSYFVQMSATDTFVDIQDVYEGLKDNERVIFVIRHAERGDDTSVSGTLTSNGKTQSQNVGKKLTKFSEDFVLGASEFLRAHQTVENIAMGRGQAYDVRDTFPELNDNWYEKNHEASEKAKSECGGGWELTSKYAYTGAYTTGTNAAFYKLDERSVELIVDVLLAKYNDPTHRFVMLSSHDKVMVPLVVYCTNKKVNLKKHDGGKWLNYLAGVAIIIDELGNRRYIPVRGLSSAYM